MNSALRPFAVVTGGSSGIGYELARECLENGYDVLIAADRDVESAKQRLSSFGGTVEAIEADLATPEGVVGNMRSRGAGRVLITGSIAGFMPGTFQAVYNDTKAFIDSFSWALRNELKDGVTITCLIPGVTDTEFFERADLMHTKVGTAEHKAEPADVAKIGFKAMLDGEGDVVAGFENKVQAAMASVTPSAVLAEQHRKMAEPGSARGK